ncbi:MAG: metallophosphoesterase [Candidatus ainarchaeum sp.]|nr:metallophosphoesterase [Candidatus ainarchaeum sp.]
MKIAVIADTHVGYPRFYEDSFTQAEAAFRDADSKADVILFLGDLYDTRVPSLQILGRTISFFRSVKKPVYAIHGNHERRNKGSLNPVGLLEKAGVINHLNFSAETFEKNGEKIFIAGMGNVPDDLGKKALERMHESVQIPEGVFSILMLHQSVKEFVFGEELLELDALEKLGYDLVLNGHIHARKEALDGKFLIPGSTVITQLTKEETQPRGYCMYDTNAKKHEFIPIPCRKFILEELDFKDAKLNEVQEKAGELSARLRGENPEAIIRIILKGTLERGIRASDLAFGDGGSLFMDNKLNEHAFRADIKAIREMREKKLSMREMGEARMRKKMDGKATLFEPLELFEALASGAEEGMAYLQGRMKPA